MYLNQTRPKKRDLALHLQRSISLTKKSEFYKIVDYSVLIDSKRNKSIKRYVLEIDKMVDITNQHIVGKIIQIQDGKGRMPLVESQSSIPGGSFDLGQFGVNDFSKGFKTFLIDFEIDCKEDNYKISIDYVVCNNIDSSLNETTICMEIIRSETYENKTYIEVELSINLNLFKKVKSIFDVKPSDPEMGMIKALLDHKNEYIPLLVQHGVNINMKISGQYTLLHISTGALTLNGQDYRDEKATLLLLNLGCDFEIKMPQNGITPFLKCIENKMYESMREMIAYGVDLDERDDSDRGALYFAIQNNDLDTIKYLMECGCSFDNYSSNSDDLLQIAYDTQNKAIIELVEVSLKSNIEIKETNIKEGSNMKKEYTIQDVIDAAKSFNMDLLEEILKSEPSFEDLGFNQMINLGFYEMPISMIPFYELFREEKDVTEGTIKILDLFIKYGMDINIERSDGNNLLTMLGYGIGQVRRNAKKDSRIEIAKYLIDNGINAKKKNIYGADFIDILNYDTNVQKEYKEIIEELSNYIDIFHKSSKKNVKKEQAVNNKNHQEKNEELSSEKELIKTFYENATIEDHKNGKILKKYSKKAKYRKVIIPPEIFTVDSKAFADNTFIEEVIFSEGVIELRSNIFANCTNLSKVTFPESLLKIGKKPFENTPRLKNLYIPKNLRLFSLSHLNYIDLDKLEINEKNPYYKNIDGIILSKSKRSKNFDELHYIQKSFDCEVLKLPECIKRFADECPIFNNRPSIKKIIIQSDISEDYVYYRTKFEIFSSFENFSEYGLSNDSISNKVIDGVLFSYTGKTILSYPPAKKDSIYKIPLEVEKIKDGCFKKARFLEIIYLHQKIKSISNYCFDNTMNYKLYIDAPTYKENWYFMHNLDRDKIFFNKKY